MKDSAPKPSLQNREKTPHLKIDSAQTELAPDPSGITPQTIHYLQRTIGNQATLKYIQRQENPARQRTNTPTIQRAETGLRDSGTSADVVSAVHAYANDPANADKHPRELLTIIMQSINTKLAALNVPQTSIVEDSAGGANGNFGFDTWVININVDRAFDSKTKISELSQDKIASVAGTLYHESRHCEQWYRMARLIAGEHQAKVNQIIDTVLDVLIPGKAVFDVAVVSLDISKRMGIPLTIALSAAMDPLAPASGKESAEAQDWYDSVYGANAAYRNAVLEVVLEVVARDLASAFTELATAHTNMKNATTDTARADAQKIIDEKTAGINTRLQTVYNTRDSVFQAELTRLSSITPRSAIQTTMLTHITNLINLIDQLKALTLNEANLNAMKALVTQLGTEVYQAYHDLPEETDAHATGDATEAQYKATPTPAPTGP